ncbi:hypothetical protein GCM10020331_060410 [Ectobacillus funiculus]
MDADIFCVQETKLQAGQIELDLEKLLSILELCGEKKDIQARLYLPKKETVICKIWHWHKERRA